jgi:hypothetical protein
LVVFVEHVGDGWQRIGVRSPCFALPVFRAAAARSAGMSPGTDVGAAGSVGFDAPAAVRAAVESSGKKYAHAVNLKKKTAAEL